MLTPSIAGWRVTLIPDWALVAYGVTFTVIALCALTLAAHLVRERDR